ncbi:hypothetical protein ACP3TN_09875 [Staphylococcus sp. IPLA37011]|uniref:hypothetical protein n=1 Tax=Staphylococcus TaxID=1279 RepID=UPI002553C15C|nr:hypothetical protein [Staphylococcus equorum]MDK9872940.1 hypothetical protein [Staphylococcus equorum]
MINENMNEMDFVQIMPAPINLFTSHKDKDGVFYMPLVCMALTNYGDVVFCDTDSSGGIEEISGTGIVKYNPETDEYIYF